MRHVDLFCGIGAFNIAISETWPEEAECAMAADVDEYACHAYSTNFGIEPAGDVREIDALPDRIDLLTAGSPCQSFSKMGSGGGLRDQRGNLIYEVFRLVDTAHPPPRVVVLENVREIVNHDAGATMRTIVKQLEIRDYVVTWRIMNALEHGVPQLRRRVLIVAFRDKVDALRFVWPRPQAPVSLDSVIEDDADDSYTLNPDQEDHLRMQPFVGEKSSDVPLMWHVNHQQRVSRRRFACALRAKPSYNYMLVEISHGAKLRRPTRREMLRLQGFPDSYQLDNKWGYRCAQRLVGNSVPVPMLVALMRAIRAATLVTTVAPPIL